MLLSCFLLLRNVVMKAWALLLEALRGSCCSRFSSSWNMRHKPINQCNHGAFCYIGCSGLQVGEPGGMLADHWAAFQRRASCTCLRYSSISTRFCRRTQAYTYWYFPQTRLHAQGDLQMSKASRCIAVLQLQQARASKDNM